MIKKPFRKTALILGLLAFLPAAVMAQGTCLFDDFEGGTNENKFKSYWYFYNDANDGGNSVIKNSEAGPPDTTGNPQLLFKGSYPGGRAGSQFAAVVDYTFGTVEPSCGAACTYGQMVGIGSQFAAEGKTNDLSNVATLTFWMKASAPMTIIVEIATADVLDFGYYFTKFDVGLDWQQYILNPKDFIAFTQPSWADPVDFNPALVQKIQWKISADEDCPVEGMLYLDDIVLTLTGGACPIPGLCPVIGAPGAGTGAVLGNLEGKTPNQNAAGYYWYAYNDAAGRTVLPGQFSSIFAGVKVDPVDPTVVDLFIQGNGFGASNGAFIDFELGPPYLDGTSIIQPFAGVGTMLSDEAGLNFYNAVQDGATGVYFDYMLKGSDFLRFEVKANQNFGNDGIVHHCLAPGSPTGQWQSISVNFDQLVLPNWEEVIALPPALSALKTTQLAKFQWAVQNAQGTKATLSIDNVHLLGAAKITPPDPGGVLDQLGPGGSRMKVTARKNAIIVNYPATEILDASIQLVNSSGEIIGSRTANKGAGIVFESSNLTNGVYFVSLSGSNKNGKTINLRKAVTLIQ